MARRGLFVGINRYDAAPELSSCEKDATAMAGVLERHANGGKNFDCRLLVDRIERAQLHRAVRELFNYSGDVLFYFSGHGSPTVGGGNLVTTDGCEGALGLSMHDLAALATSSRAATIFIILDCCYSGAAGDRTPSHQGPVAELRKGVTILAASSAKEVALESGEHGVFTELLLGGLRGGAADVRGRVSAAGLYAYAEQALGAWDQRPMYKSHADSLPPLRFCEPAVEDSSLRKLVSFFPDAEASYPMDPSFEHTHSDAIPENVEVFEIMKEYRNARLLETEDDLDLYYVAVNSKSVRLSALGQFYWSLASDGRL